VRRWAEHHGGRPCRRLDGHPWLAFGPAGQPAIPVGWDELEAAFVLGRCVLACDDAPGSVRCFIGTEPDVRAFVRSRGAA
jgi:hypothetical protein